MNKRQAKKKNKNQFDKCIRNYKERKSLRKYYERAKQGYKFQDECIDREDMAWLISNGILVKRNA